MTVTINGTTGITNDGGYTGDGVVFADTTPANTLVTTTGGNVGIGTSSPSVKLQVQSGVFHITDGTQTLRQGVTTGLGFVGMQTNNPLVLFTNDTERARIDSSGNLLVNQTSGSGRAGKIIVDGVVNATAGMDMLQNASTTQTQIYFRNSNGVVGQVSTNGSATTYSTSSDYRLKHDIAPMTGALAKVAALKPCTYKWNADGSDGEGFIAHELAEVVPDCVTGEKDAVDAEGKPVYQGIDTSFLTATITAALQELHQIVKDQAAEIAELKAIVDAQGAEIAALKGTQP